MFFRIKKGSFIRGSSRTGGARKFSANDPQNNIIESDEDLAGQEPEKFEVYAGHLTQEQRDRAGFSNNPTQDVDLETLSPEQLEEEAQRMIERAAELKRTAVVKRETEAREEEEAKASPASKGKAITGQEKRTPQSVLEKVSKTPPKSEKEYHEMVDKLSISDLRAHAKERNVDVTGVNTREQMAAKIKSAKIEEDKE